MQFICQKSDFIQGINTVLKAVPSKTTMPILECILIRAQGDQITLTANDMELGIETRIHGFVPEPGMIALEAKLFSEIIRKLPDSEVTIQTDGNMQVLIRCEKARFQIPARAGDDFVFLPEIAREHSIHLSEFSLKELIRQTTFALDDDSTNSLLKGALFQVSDDILKVVAMDGHRVAIRRMALKQSFDDASVIVPGKTLNEVGKILPGGSEDEVSIYFTDLHIVFAFAQTTVVSRLIEGQYFDVNRILSDDYEIRIRVSRRELQDCMERASLLIRENDRQPVIMLLSENVLQMDVLSQMGALHEVIDAEQEGKDIRIGFDAKYFLDALRVIDDETIDLFLMNAKSPCYIRDEEETYNYVILPINIGR